MFFFLQSRHELEILLSKWELVQFIFWKRMKSMLKMESIIIVIAMFGKALLICRQVWLRNCCSPPASACQMLEIQACRFF